MGLLVTEIVLLILVGFELVLMIRSTNEIEFVVLRLNDVYTIVGAS